MTTPVPKKKPKSKKAAPANEPLNDEGEYLIQVRVSIPFYGKPEQAQESIDTIGKMLALHFFAVTVDNETLTRV